MDKHTAHYQTVVGHLWKFMYMLFQNKIKEFTKMGVRNLS